MAEESIDRRQTGALERHVHSILLTVIASGLLFMIKYFYDDNADKAILRNNVTALTAQVVEMRAEQRAMQVLVADNFARKQDLKEIEARLRQLERGAK